MIQTLRIPGMMPGLNDLIAAKGRFSQAGNRRHEAYNQLKRQWGRTIGIYCRTQGIAPVESCELRFIWTEPTRRRDPDNIAAGGRKLILDGLVSAGVLTNDGWGQVRGWVDEFRVDREAQGVEIIIISE